MAIHDFLKARSYPADFGLRYVWVASVSALDHYVTELIVEKSTEHFSNGVTLRPKLANEGVPISSLMSMHAIELAKPQAIVEFRGIVRNALRFQTFQKADDIADGLAYVWGAKHKWAKIAKVLGMDVKSARRKLNGIGNRRDLIVHNADYDEATGNLMPCVREDALEVVAYIKKVVEAIDSQVP